MDNQQLCNLKNEQLQVLLTGIFGDGCLHQPNTIKHNYYYVTNCKYLEYINYKSKLLGELVKSISFTKENGYCKTPIHSMRTSSHKSISYIASLNIEQALTLIDDLGVALWFYDDGSLHKTKHFYNLNTHAFDKHTQKKYFIPFFNKLNIFPKITKEAKKDGRIFYYLRISRFEGAYEINKILQKYKIDCYNYKLWSSETILNWSKLQVQLKSQGVKVSNKRFGVLFKILQNGGSTQDIVQSLEKSKAGVIPLNN